MTYGVYMGPKSHHLTLQDLEIRDVANGTGRRACPVLGQAGRPLHDAGPRHGDRTDTKPLGLPRGHCVYEGQGTTTESGHHLTIEQSDVSRLWRSRDIRA